MIGGSACDICMGTRQDPRAKIAGFLDIIHPLGCL